MSVPLADLPVYALIVTSVAIAILSLLPRDLYKAVIVGGGIEGMALAVLFMRLLTPDVAITQAILASALLPALMFIAVYKTDRWES
jgi:energy-converting hydrogenase B subunit D